MKNDPGMRPIAAWARRSAGAALLATTIVLPAHAGDTGIKDDVKRTGEAVGSAAREAGRKAKDIGAEIGQGAKKAGTEIGKGAKKVGTEIAQGAKKAGTEIAQGCRLNRTCDATGSAAGSCSGRPLMILRGLALSACQLSISANAQSRQPLHACSHLRLVVL